MTDRLVPLGEVANVVRGVSFDKGEALDAPRDGYVPILRAGNIETELLLDDDLVWVPGARVAAEQRMRLGDIAICMSSGSQAVVGKTAPLRRDWPGSVGAFCALIRPLAGRVQPDYLAFFLKSERFRSWTRQSSGANIKNIRKSELEAFAVPSVSLDEQCRIVDLLSRAESIVRLRREAQAKAQAVIPALFLDMFGDPATNPKGWPVATLGDALRAADYGSSTKASGHDAGLPLIRMGNVTYAGDLDLSDLKYVELEPDDVQRFRLERGDILFNRTNSKELVGKTGLWDVELEAVAASYFIRLRARNETTRPYYLWAFMNSRHMKRVLFDTARGAIGQANINSKELKAFRLPLPPLDRQACFEERCRAILGIVAQQREAITRAEAAFQSLLGRSFSGSLTAAASTEEIAGA